MTTEIRVPTLGESVTEATVAQWYKKPGDAVNADEPLVELETDKVTLEVPAPASGTLEDILVQEGDTVEVNALLGIIAEGAGAPAKSAPAATEPAKESAPEKAAAQPAPQAAPQPSSRPAPSSGGQAMPSAARVMEENGLDAHAIQGTGKDGRITKGDALEALERLPAQQPAPRPAAAVQPRPLQEREERVRMSRLRQTIAQRLKEAQNTAAMLTTFNEVDMSHVMELRSQYKDLFEKRHGVKLGFMSFFVKACIRALQEIPAVNGEIDGTDVIYKNYYNIGVAVGTDRGLVVPVLQDADVKSFAEVEAEIADFGRRARDGNLSIEELQGGTFTVTNGGVYGSLMSTPILNPPQSGVLGMHKIEQRPVVVGGEVTVRPMMYLALSYDHRLVDGKEAVTFLVRVKETLEDPQRALLGL